MKDITKVFMNPIRQRIIQYLMTNKEASTKLIGEALSDIPTPTLYRHIKILLDADVICVVGEEQMRGAVQKTYALNPKVLCDLDSGNVNTIIQNSLTMIGASFQAFFAKEDADMKKDMLNFTTAILLLSDEECNDFFQQINDVITRFAEKTSNKERKTRRITLISSPCEEE